ESARHLQRSEEVDGQMLLDEVGTAQIVVVGDAGIVDEDVEGVDLVDRTLDLRIAGHIQRQGSHAPVGAFQCATRSRIDPLRPPLERLVDEGATDAAVGARDQDRLVGNVHSVLPSMGLLLRPGYVSWAAAGGGSRLRPSLPWRARG